MTPEQIIDERRKRVQETFKLDPQVPIKLKGKDYTLEVNNYAVKKILQDTGFNLLEAGFKRSAMDDPSVMGCLLFRALETNHPDLTQDTVDKMYTYRHYVYVLECLRLACEMFMPDMSDLEEMLPKVEGPKQDPT